MRTQSADGAAWFSVWTSLGLLEHLERGRPPNCMCKHSQRCLAAGNRKTDCPKGVQRQSQQSNAVLLAVAHIADLVNLVSNPGLRSDLGRACQEFCVSGVI